MGFLEGMDFGDILQAGSHGIIKADLEKRREKTKAVKERVKKLTDSLLKQQETAHAASIKAHQDRQTKAEAIKATGGDDVSIGKALGFDYDDIRDMKQRQKDPSKPLWTVGDLEAWVGQAPQYTLPRNVTKVDTVDIGVGTNLGDQVRGLFGAGPQKRDTAESVLERAEVNLTPDNFLGDRGGSLVAPTGGDFDWTKKKEDKQIAVEVRMEVFENDWEEEYGFTGFPNEEKLAIAINSGSVPAGTSLKDLRTTYKKGKQIAMLGTRPTAATSGGPKIGTIKKMYIGGSTNQALQYTGNSDDVYKGYVGWVPWGAEESTKTDGKDQFQTMQLNDNTTIKLIKSDDPNASIVVNGKEYKGWLPFGEPKTEDPSGLYHVTATDPEGNTVVKFFKPNYTESGAIAFTPVAEEVGRPPKKDKKTIPSVPNEAERNDVTTFLDDKVLEDSDIGRLMETLGTWNTDNRGNAKPDSRKFAANFRTLRNDIADTIKQRQYHMKQIGQEYHFTTENINSVLTELYNKGAFEREVDDTTGWFSPKRKIYTRVPDVTIYPRITDKGLTFVDEATCRSDDECKKTYFSSQP